MHSMKRGMQILLVSGLGLAAYANTLRNGFVWDDRDAIVTNHFIRQAANLPQLVSREYFPLSQEMSYRPLVTLTYFLDYAVWRLNPAGYHLQNIIWHVLTVVLLLLLLRAVLRDDGAALVAACLFAVHPVCTEAVNVVSFREDLMAGSFMALSFLAYAGSARGRGWPAVVSYLVALVSFLAGLLSKEMAATLPALLILFDVWVLRKRTVGSLLQRAFTHHLGFVCVLGFYLFLRFLVLYNPRETGIGHVGGSLWISLLTTSRIVATYIKLLFIPLGLSAKYHFAPSQSILDTDVVLSLLLIAGCLAYAWRVRRRAPAESFAAAAFFLLLAPVLNIVPIVNIAAERYLYVPCAAFCLWLALFARRRGMPAWGFALLVFCYGAVTAARNTDWKDSYTIWSKTARRFPDDPDVHHELGDAYQQQGRLQEAVEHYLKALSARPHHVPVRVNLGVCYDALGDLDAALEQYTVALQADPTVSKVHNNVGNVLFKKGRFEEALQAYREAIRLNPHYPEPHNNMTAALLELNRLEAALAATQTVLDMVPDDPQAQVNLAVIRLRQGREDESRRLLDTLLAQGRMTVRIRFVLGGYYAEQGRLAEAAEQYRAVLSEHPQEAAAHFELGTVLEHAGDRQGAARHYETFLRLWEGPQRFADQAREALNRMRAAP